jgi:hypothetical protein
MIKGTVRKGVAGRGTREKRRERERERERERNRKEGRWDVREGEAER